MLPVPNALELLQKVEVENLYQHLIMQLNKDFQLSNLSENFELSYTPIQLKKVLNKLVLNLLTNNYDDYLNLMYRIDVPEKELATLKAENLETTVEQITFLILKREYQKVWFKNRL
ncbi:hypothetical protein [Lutibacter sp.]|uniref:hypothetical protein n=1 Tax=Lutibacter sp. TaxID=1925666 RepID=UPI00356B2509